MNFKIATMEAIKKRIKRRLKLGYPAGEIKHEIMQEGLSEEAVENIFNSLNKASNDRSGYGSESAKSQAYILIGSGLLITGVAILSFSRESLLGIIMAI